MPNKLVAGPSPVVWGLWDKIRGVQRSGDTRGDYLIIWPLPNSVFEKYEKYRRSKTTYPASATCKKDYATKTSPQARIKKRRKLFGSRTTLRNSSKAADRCKMYVQTAQSFTMSLWARRKK